MVKQSEFQEYLAWGIESKSYSCVCPQSDPNILSFYLSLAFM